MQWMTTSYVHLDRVAMAWLIRRFVDPSAEFLFRDRTTGRPEVGADLPIPFGMADVPLAGHDQTGTGFAKVMAAYRLDADEALRRVERLVHCGVAHALGSATPADSTPEDRQLGAALDLLGVGLGITFTDDDHIEAAMALYDGLYTLCRTWCLPDDSRRAAPGAGPARVEYYRDLLALSRLP